MHLNTELVSLVFKFCPYVFITNVGRLVSKTWFIAATLNAKTQEALDAQAALFLTLLESKQFGDGDRLAVKTVHDFTLSYIARDQKRIAYVERALGVMDPEHENTPYLKTEIFYALQTICMPWLPFTKLTTGFTPAGLEIIRRLDNHEPIIGVTAGAGAGKSTFSCKLIDRQLKLENQNILFTAFNNLIVDDIFQRFRGKHGVKDLPPGLSIATLHALAVRSAIGVGIWKDRVIDSDDAALARAFRFEVLDAADEDVEDYLEELRLYCNGQIPVPEPAVLSVYKRMLDSEDPLGQTMEVLLHWFAHAACDDAYTLIIVDEAQDMNALMLQWLNAQKSAQKIYLGDSSQTINSFMYCSDVLSTMNDKVVFPSSRRFGKNIARLVNRIHTIAKREAPLLFAHGPDTEVIPIHRGEIVQKVTFLASLNRNVFERALVAIDNDQTVAFLGGFAKTMKAVIDNAHRLDELAFELVTKKTTRRSWWFKQFTTDPQAFSAKLRRIEENTTSVESADVVLGTAFVTKGLEFNNVELCPDLYVHYSNEPGSQLHKLWVLLVACTRAKHKLYIPTFPTSTNTKQTLWRLLML